MKKKSNFRWIMSVFLITFLLSLLFSLVSTNAINDLPLIMVKCLLFTIIIEVLVALLLKIKDKKDILNIILVNVMTNPIVVTIPILMLVLYGYKARIISLIILEVLTVIVEGLIYFKVFKYKKINPLLVSLILNISSYFIGEIINKI